MSNALIFDKCLKNGRRCLNYSAVRLVLTTVCHAILRKENPLEWYELRYFRATVTPYYCTAYWMLIIVYEFKSLFYIIFINSCQTRYKRNGHIRERWNFGCIRWFKYDRDWLCVNKSQFVPVIFEPPCIILWSCPSWLLKIARKGPFWQSDRTWRGV
jgi:hypothetical protein